MRSRGFYVPAIVTQLLAIWEPNVPSKELKNVEGTNGYNLFHTFTCSNKFLQVESCEACQKNSYKFLVTSTELHPVPVHATWYHIASDNILSLI